MFKFLLKKILFTQSISLKKKLLFSLTTITIFSASISNKTNIPERVTHDNLVGQFLLNLF